ncbi:MAG: type II toxin-antitoxin system VapC family toxin [Acidobacteria bacterium]|nr:type II toxin-antitoxin system VapC family toxin [Acidobacteriota bacterium]
MGPISPRLAAGLAGHDRVAVDTAPFVYFLVGEGARADAIKGVLKMAEEGRLALVSSVVTETELLVRPLRLGDAGKVRVIRELLEGWPGLSLADVTRDISREAAQIRAERGLSLGDALIAATAVRTGCSALLSNDEGFRRVDGTLVYLHLDDLIGGGS